MRAPVVLRAWSLVIGLVLALAPAWGCCPAPGETTTASAPGETTPGPGAVEAQAQAQGWSTYLSPTQVPQGGLAVLTVIGDRSTPLRGVEGELLDTPLRFGQQGNAFFALVGIDCGDPPGRHTIRVQATDAQGRAAEISLTITVTARWFPRQYLAVDKSQEELVSDDTSWNEDRARVGRAKSASASRPLWTGAFQMPVAGQVTTAYGFLRYVNGQVEGQHSGLDLACEEGTPVHAAQAGVVVLSDTLNITGETVILDHGLGLFSSYCHLSQRLAEVGQVVEPGDVLGRVGSTGFATGPHLHWSTTVGPVAVDPRILLQADPLQGAEWPRASGPQAALTPPHQTHAAAPRG